jgi:hypothetical protein
MKILSPKTIIFLSLLLLLGFWLYLNVPYLNFLTEYLSLKGSGVRYALRGQGGGKNVTLIKPVSTKFGLVITKIGLNEKITAGGNLYDSEKLGNSLKLGLNHIKASALPGGFGAVLIVGHPLDKFFNLNHLNPSFYLINQLEVGDKVNLFFKDLNYFYKVAKKEIVPPTFLDFFDPGSEKKLLLVSGFPAGMAFKFLVIEAAQIGEGQ